MLYRAAGKIICVVAPGAVMPLITRSRDSRSKGRARWSQRGEARRPPLPVEAEPERPARISRCYAGDERRTGEQAMVPDRWKRISYWWAMPAEHLDRIVREYF